MQAETTEAPVTVTENQESAIAPFRVKNRSRAQRLAKVLYGATARTWINRKLDVFDGTLVGVQIGTEKDKDKKVLTSGTTFTEALLEPVQQYIKGASTYADTKRRIVVMAADANVAIFVEDALSQFPVEYGAEKKLLEEQRLRALSKLLVGKK